MEKFNLITNSLVDLGDDLEVEGNGKGRKFVSKFIEPGVASYEQFGDVLITKETLNKFINTMVGCPVIIKHKDITDKNADKERVGVVSDVWFNEQDGWFYCSGIIWDKQAIDLVKNQGWNVSCTYDFESDKQEKTHNGKKIDMEFTDGEFLHLALVDNPRYERANIVMNSKDTETDKVDNGWITKYDENGEPIKIFIEGYHGQSAAERNRKADILRNYKKGQETKYDFEHTRSKLSDTQKQQIKNKIADIYNTYVGKPLAQVEVRSIGGGALGLCTSSDSASILSLDSSLFSGKYTQEQWEKSIKNGFHPQTDNKDLITGVLTHELGHSISVNTDSKGFWTEIEKVRSEYLKNITREDIKNPDFISNYARANKYEFVAEAFAQGNLSKKYGKYTKQVMEIMNKHLKKTNQLKLVASNENKEDNDTIIWEEDFGNGYPLDEETYNKFKEEQEQAKDNKQDKASNSLLNGLNDIMESYQPEKADLPILKGLEKILEI